MIELLTQREAAEKLGVAPTRIKQLWAENQLLKVVVDSKPMVPALSLSNEGGVFEPLASIHGSMLMLLDAGFSHDEATEWLITKQDSLDAVPLELLAQNRVREVRNAILPLAF
ncbi:MAG: Rv2175c family DNA-binding protein [Actinomycetaceae bacterium]|nr:Rv2175c family DNA-binding protein [Actinomycetaceae bacterium]